MQTLKLSVAWVLALALFFPTLAAAQTEGRFVGVVLDQSGAVVPGATVVVKNERTGDQRTVLSNAEGRYIVANLAPSVYTIRATFGQLAPLEFTGLQLVAAQEFALDLSLAPAGITETVNVQAQFQSIDISSARIGVNVSEREISELPVNGRQMSQLMLQAPGSQNAGTGTWSDVRFSGRAVNQNVIKFDGVEGSSIIDASPGNLGGQISSPFKLQASLENVQEFRVESNNYPAEFGTGTGGQVSVVTKSGSNLWSGSLFEYYRDDALDAPNYFDSTRRDDGSVIQELPKSKLNQHQFGGSFGGPIVRDKLFLFGSYEGYRLDAGVNFVEAAPSDASWAKAVPAVQPLRPGFVAPGAVLIPGVSNNTDYDIFQLQGLEEVEENSFSMRLDYRMNSKWSSYVRVFSDRGEQLRPEGISGRVVRVTNEPTNAIFNLQGTFGNGLLNEFKVGYNGPSSNVRGIAPSVPGSDFSNIAISLTGSVANTGIAGQSASSGIVVPGGLVRASSATNGREVIYDPYSVAFADSASLVRGNHLAKIGGDLRMIRMTTDQLGGITYSYSNVTNFLANVPAQIQYLGDISAPSVFNDGATGMRHTSQQYYTVFGQDEWHVTPNLTLNYGLRYEYYTPLKERDNLIVKFNIETGQIEPNTTPLHGSKKDSVQPRLSATYALGSGTVLRAGYGIFVGPGQGEDLIQPIESDRVSTTLSSGQFLAYPINQELLVSNFTSNPNNRSYQPRAYSQDYAIPEKVHQYTASVQQELGSGFATTIGYVGSQGRNLFLRSVANNIVDVATNPNPANAAFVIREFSIVTRDANGNVTGVQNPYAEVDFKTSGGKDSYNAMMLSLNRRSTNGIATNLQYTFSTSRGTSGGSNEANTAANNARTLDQFDYEDGYNNFDVRHTFNISALYSLPFGRGRKYGHNANALSQALLGGWELGGIFNARSGIPINVLVTRNDILYRDSATGLFYSGPAAGRVAVINTPRGGQSRNVRRPDLVPGVNPFITDGGLIYLNPAAFAAPLPGTFGNMERNAVHGPTFNQIDFFFAKQFHTGARSNAEFRLEVFNMFDTANFANPSGTLNAAIPATPGQTNTIQPGEAYTAAAAGPAFGRMTSTVGRTVGLGTPRQVQLALRFQF